MSLWTRLWNLLCDTLDWLFWGIRIVQGITWTLVYLLWHLSLGWLVWAVGRPNCPTCYVDPLPSLTGSPLRLLGLAFLGNCYTISPKDQFQSYRLVPLRELWEFVML